MIEQIIVLGGGAIGSVYAAKLAERHDVTLIARPAHAEAINRGGLRVIGHEQAIRRMRAQTAGHGYSSSKSSVSTSLRSLVSGGLSKEITSRATCWLATSLPRCCFP